MRKKKKQIFIWISGAFIIVSLIWLFASLPIQPKNTKGSFGSFFRSAENLVSNTANSTNDFLLYNAYKAYMSWLNGGTRGGKQRLHSSFVEKLKPYYQNNLNNVRVVETTRFTNLAITDCETVYFGDSLIVPKLKKGEKLTRREFLWLAHELTHTEQCNRAGGRKKYALRWFSEVDDAVINTIASGNFTEILSDITSAQRLARYDNAMNMEAEADKKAQDVTRTAFSE